MAAVTAGHIDEVISLPLPGVSDGFGLLSRPLGNCASLGVLVLVGGPQYRVGSHRHFVQLARSMADAGYPCLRFDHRGIGDTPGEIPDFEALDDDVHAAIDALLAAVPTLKGVLLWGLCDGASAALLYVSRMRDPRVRALTLLNPWVRSAQGEAQTRVRHYYLERLKNPAFWKKLLSGKVAASALSGFIAQWQKSRGDRAAESGPPRTFQRLMAQGWQSFSGPLLLQLSGRDHTAREFESVAERFPDWQDWQRRAALTRLDYPDADHTFSQPALQQRSINDLLDWLLTLPARD